MRYELARRFASSKKASRFQLFQRRRTDTYECLDAGTRNDSRVRSLQK